MISKTIKRERETKNEKEREKRERETKKRWDEGKRKRERMFELMAKT